MRNVQQRGRTRGMGTDGWDDDSLQRGGAPRNRRPPNDGSPDRVYGRGMRESARSADGPGSRYGRRDDWGDAGRSGGNGGSGYGGRGRPGAPGGSGRGSSRAPRDDYEDDYRSRGRGMPADRSVRGRAAARPDAWDAPQQRGRRPAGQGGLWDDEPRARRPRPGGSDPSSRMPGRYDPRDPRARRGAPPAAAKKSGGISFSTAFGIIVLMFLLGGGAAFGLFTLTKPAVKADPSAGPTPTVPATVSPTVPQATPTKTSFHSGGRLIAYVAWSASTA